MRQSLVLLALTWLLNAVIAVENDLIDLQPLARHVWDKDALRKRDDPAGSVALQDHEQFMWTSGNEPNTKVTAVSMVVWSRQDERILDMDKISFALDSVSCTDGMTLKFKNKLFYLAAKFAWEWVNYNDMRSFVMVSSWEGCGTPRERDPWVVSNAVFDDKASTAKLAATKSTWQKVSNTTVLDFGDIVVGHQGTKDKRFLDVSLNKAFTLDVSSSFPTEIVNWTMNTPFVDASLAINCVNCGTTGTLAFAGHVEASLFGGLEKFELSAAPRNIAANLDLSLEFKGEVDFDGLPAPGKEWTLVELPLPSGWRVPGVLTFGPNVKINAGYTIEYIGGEASVTTGISARVPDSSVAKVDLASKNPVTISGWIPEIETKPLEIEAQIHARAKLYTEVAVAASIEAFDNGLNVEVGIKVPDITVTAAAGYTGFCANDPNKAYGVKLDAALGASLGLQGYTEVKGERDVFLDVTLYETPTLYTFPQLCLAAGEESPGTCIPQSDPLDPDDGVAPGVLRRDTRSSVALARRDADSAFYQGRDPYYLACDEGRTKQIWVQKYQRPSRLRNNAAVPIIQPGMSCSNSAQNQCPASTWNIKEVPKDDRAGVTRQGWASEHIYEGNWVRDFIDYLVTNYYPATIEDPNVQDNTKCKGAMNTFGIQRDISTPNPTVAFNYSEALMQNLGTVHTASTLMAIFPNRQNGMKYTMFAGNDIDGKFKTSEKNINQRVCSLGRIVTICQYMNHEEIRTRMKATIAAIDGLLDTMQQDVNIYLPSSLKTETLKTAHAKFFEEKYKGGFRNARNRLQDYASWLQGQAGFGNLDQATKDEVAKLASNPEAHCTEIWPL
ncbi:uncharacterized protein AFUA_2G00270 [Aspergillus fumigatus Af293]|uniref:Uncharacterized protein n=1 Tax=Aspergillus fumigatus (strain ATCC MYA-4609 / CBS 101355 / FGSC A1100 / Af293) TaxID=330879 RepID=A4D9V3_ASPFU|nr:conserved hypothetical protein [Aspergillus fumigatus Af293]EBA27300.1 conserved hypothetical protein [Aspergillus fumigatus Af293]